MSIKQYVTLSLSANSECLKSKGKQNWQISILWSRYFVAPREQKNEYELAVSSQKTSVKNENFNWKISSRHTLYDA